MNYRDTQLYREMTLFKAIGFIEKFGEQPASETDYLTAWQYIADSNAWTFLQGCYERQLSLLIDQQLIDMPKELNGQPA